MWVGGGVPPPGALLDTGFRRYDDGGCGKFESRRRPCPGFPLSRERRLGERWDARGLVVVEGPFDRLRANGISKRACGVGWWGRAAAWRTSGYRLSPVRRWRVWEVREAEAPRAAPLPWVPAKAGTTVGGSGAACRYCVGLPHPAPLDSCLRRNDARRRRRRPRTAPLPWVPAFARTTVGGVCGTRRRCWCRRALRQAQGERSLSAWRGSCFLGNGCIEPGGPSTGSGRTETRITPTVVVGARGVRGSEWIGLDDGAYAAVHVYGGAGYEAGSF